MRRILIEIARRKKCERHGGDRQQVELPVQDLPDVGDWPGEQLLALHEALVKLAVEDPTAASLVELRFFAGLSIEQAGEILGFPRATAYRHWNYARAWLRCEIQRSVNSTGN
jgi:RNA polymerase sigma factor (TIGR02999 family)